MASSTKHALADALKQMMEVKPIAKITVKDRVEICNVNRQTFYYHFDDVYDLLEWVFEEDANKVLPQEVVYEHWREDVVSFFKYLHAGIAQSVEHFTRNEGVVCSSHITSSRKLSGSFREAFFIKFVC